ncbi:MAG: UbiX family flavin prenyltransferase [Candidatus Thermoplasmatota archaeon]|nr:UbiX family flavin prenyltransferase [Euryarchaeota archaeon]MBU4032694.1 UbiX family flavin prenyltransferase [Candidatus Thermoplasmatota archaeon]MBU4071673.1 UbiX family flavin prenyltransferase [Candidatus Thermoplasmatota archaeon]MBU4145305.1 UbiX family flavin prenyltransferase [Candidatus Thermoplasmatota archaeon]MBU4591068.1 UbiX family flavin prenyltransferase [Candidatus Thermoplasmatota archaeon]
MNVIVGITGASGALYATRLVEELSDHTRVIMIASDTAKQIIVDETETNYDELEELAHESFSNHDMNAAICSGSREFDAMVILPCSMTTLAKISCGIADNVITRAASVALKERRKLIIVPRETPLTGIHLENMLKLSREGAIILPAMPGFYGRPETALELVDFIVGRIMDLLGLENEIGPRWGQDSD